MSYELTNDSGGEMRLLPREWQMLLILAKLKEWEPERGDIGHYAQGGVVSGTDAAGIAAAVERALPDVPAFYADGLTEAERVRPQILGELRQRPGDEEGDPFAYWSGRGRNRLLLFVREMASGPFRVQPMPGFSPEF
jgi:hypothetical protein